MASKADRESFTDAVVLAKFANLAAEEVAGFRANYPDFVPQEWWNYTPDQWQSNQRWLREAWGIWGSRRGVGLFRVMNLVMSVFDPSDIWDAPETGNRSSFVEWQHLINRELPYHRAVLYLERQPWRAKRCANCGRYIVVRVAKTKYCERDDCGNNIREINHRAAKLRSWHRNRRRWRKVHTASTRHKRRSPSKR
jgi:hypothetical protein